MKNRWGKNYSKPTKGFIKNQAMNKLKESLKQILIDTLNIPCGYLDVFTHSEAQLLDEEKVEPVRKQALEDLDEMTKNLPRKKKKKLRKTYQEFKQIW